MCITCTRTVSLGGLGACSVVAQSTNTQQRMKETITNTRAHTHASAYTITNTRAHTHASAYTHDTHTHASANTNEATHERDDGSDEDSDNDDEDIGIRLLEIALLLENALLRDWVFQAGCWRMRCCWRMHWFVRLRRALCIRSYPRGRAEGGFSARQGSTLRSIMALAVDGHNSDDEEVFQGPRIKSAFEHGYSKDEGISYEDYWAERRKKEAEQKAAH